MRTKNKIIMWYEVQELRKKRGYSQSQISRETNLSRKTVRKYLKMNEDEFIKWISVPRQMPLKLSKYIDFVRQELEACPFYSAAQIEDHLKEHHEDLPNFHSKTVYNLVMAVRKKYDIPKPKITEQRIFEKLPETAYGAQSQVDFGESWQVTTEGKRKKIYFFVMVLSRSRYKYVLFSQQPFTSEKAVNAHQGAFEYFEGVPKEVVYDQDSVFIHNENLGDYLLTEKFRAYCHTQNFTPVFCRKSDPQSKGKVENAVKYVKQNFLRGRTYKNIGMLQQQALEWLARTANKKAHSTTKIPPGESWQEEKKHLLPIKNKIHQKEKKRSYNVRKDNTIVYKSNYYSLPAGTYKKPGTRVFLESDEGKINIYSEENELIASHKISIGKGGYIRNTDHKRQKSRTLEQMETKAMEMLGQTEIAGDYLKKIRQDKQRYYKDNLQEIIKQPLQYGQQTIDESIMVCIEAHQYNAFVLLEVMKSKHLEEQQKQQAQEAIKNISQPDAKSAVHNAEMEVLKSDINEYEKIF